MDKTIKILRTCFWTYIAISVAMVVVMETETIVLTCDCEGSEFAVVSIMELATLILLPTALYLFRTNKIRIALQGSPAALRKWGTVRLGMVGLPMVADTLLYYIYMNASLGYMAVISLICMIFVYPGKGKCLADISAKE